jgi:secreted trypsin-like serine protease
VTNIEAQKILHCLKEKFTMKLIFLVIFVVSFSFASTEESSSFIVGGEDATVEEYPYMAGILNFGLSGCGGTIINQRSVLTVRNCCVTVMQHK